jgi:(p)ppGpp synthase/HD superfamily hydrolase
MTWNYQLRAAVQQRLLSRILQILETQRMIIHSFAAEISDERLLTAAFQVSSPEDKQYRIEALLYRLEGVLHVASTNAD